jgi:hypothetical protein
MTEQEQQQLLTENAWLRAALTSERQGNEELRDANANLRIERDATDALLGAAMDEALRVRKA